MIKFTIYSELEEVKLKQATLKGKQIYNLEVTQELYGDYDKIIQAIKVWISDTEGHSIGAVTLARREIDLKDFNYKLAEKQGSDLIKKMKGSNNNDKKH